MDKTFICLSSDQGLQLLNLYQIVRVSIASDDQIDIYMSDGQSYRAHGEEGIGKLIAILTEHAMTLDGEPLSNEVTRERARDSGLKLVKREDEE